MVRALALACTTLALLLAVPVSFAIPLSFVAHLSGPNENPTNNSPGTGTARVTLDIAANTLSFDVDFAGLFATLIDGTTPSGTTAAHIHCCTAPPNNVAVAITAAPSLEGFPLDVNSGLYMNTFDTTLASTYRPGFIAANGGTTAGAEAALLAGLQNGQAYFNIHTDRFTGGEIRGFLAQVPETGTFALLGLALGALVITRRRKL